MEDAIVKRIKIALLGSALAMLSGCIAVPVGPGYYSGYQASPSPPPDYSDPGGAPYYYGAPYYPYYYPYYYGPAVGVGVYGRFRYRR